MKKNYTLKILLAMLVVVLVSLVSFVGVYKGKNLLKEYSLGSDFKGKKVATFKAESILEDNNDSTAENESETNEENAEENAEQKQDEENVETTDQNEENKEPEDDNSQENSEENTDNPEEKKQEDIQKKYRDTKNIIEKRLRSMEVEEYNVRVDEGNGNLVIEFPQDMDVSYISQIVQTGKAQILNSSTNEVVIESSGFKDIDVRLDSTKYSKPIVLIKVEFTKDAKNVFKNINTNYTDSEGNESEATFEFSLDGQALYSDSANSFAQTAKNGSLDLVIGQNDEGEELEKDYKNALALAALIRNGEISINYTIESADTIQANTNIKNIIIAAVIIGAIMLLYAIFKFKQNSILPCISLVGLVATILLVLRYTNVKITTYTILGIAIITIANYILILKTLGNDKPFKSNFMKMIDILVPCFIIAVVFCCAPYLRLATLGMTIFWGTITMIIYNALITRILINNCERGVK